jgi:hypothetical protein
MSTFKINLSKRTIADAADSNLADYAETFADSSAQSQSSQDIEVAVWCNGVLKDTQTVTDAGATLSWTETLSTGSHSIKVVPAKSADSHTDVRVDNLFIDDVQTVATQYNYLTATGQGTSTARQLLSEPVSKIKDQSADEWSYTLWWGTMVTNNASYDLPGPFYRPAIVSDHEGEWHFDFDVNSNGTISFSAPGDTDDIMYDSTRQHTYMLAQKPTWHDPLGDGWGGNENDSSSSPYIGPGTYSERLIYVDASVDESTEDAGRVVVLSFQDYLFHKFNLWYHDNNTVTPITVS